MDSLTQITLGAAVGEAVLGRKLGNRAMLWGAIGGTIPDLDVISNLWLSDVDALAAHRGITHSIFFSVVAAIPIAWLVWKLYADGGYARRGWKNVVFLLNTVFFTAVGFLIFRLFLGGSVSAIVISGIVIAGLLTLFIRWLWRYRTGDPSIEIPALKEWYLMFFLAFFTHIALDCFTSYGTQVFQPFSNYKAAFDTIAVVDPVYTLPFIACLIVVMTKARGTRGRRIWNWLGIGISSAYLLFTVINKQLVDARFERSLTERGIEAERCRTSPTIFNNILWNCAAEDDSMYYLGLYSLYDSGDTLHFINAIPKNRDLVYRYEDDKTMRTLRWFSNDYLNVYPVNDSSYILSDFRFGAMRDTITGYRDFVFNFKVVERGDKLSMQPYRERPENISEEFRHFIARIKGYR